MFHLYLRGGARVFRSFLLAILCTFLAAATPAIAQNPKLDAALARLAADDFAETTSAIDEIAASGAPHAATLLDALADRRLGFAPADKAVYWRDSAGKLYAAPTAEPQPPGLTERTAGSLAMIRSSRSSWQSGAGWV